MVSLEKGAFVLIEGPDDSCWVAQLLEPYTGKLSEEVDDVDDDGPRISLRWLYTPDELPRLRPPPPPPLLLFALPTWLACRPSPSSRCRAVLHLHADRR